MSLSTVTVGLPTLASDINQIINLLTSAAAGTVKVANGSVPGSDTPVVGANALLADANPRAALYLRSDGYGGLSAGNAGTPIQFYASSGGWVASSRIIAPGFYQAHGTQETGNASVGDFGTGGTVSGLINFKASFLSTPTGIGYAVVINNNSSGFNAAYITPYGFQIWTNVVPGGACVLQGQYTTSGY